MYIRVPPLAGVSVMASRSWSPKPLMTLSSRCADECDVPLGRHIEARRPSGA